MSDYSRTQTFVFEFKDEKVFRDFFQKYIQEGQPGIFYKSVSEGDKVKLLDECQVALFEAADAVFDPDLSEKFETLAVS